MSEDIGKEANVFAKIKILKFSVSRLGKEKPLELNLQAINSTHIFPIRLFLLGMYASVPQF